MILLLIIFISAPCFVFSQGDEASVIAEAESLFQQSKYQEALPLFAQLVSVHPQNPEYNYKFGVCTLLGDRSNHRRPIRYLNNALKGIDNEPLLNYYLGLAYYQNEEFANAIKFLNQYLGTLDPQDDQRPLILEMVNASVNGMNLEHEKHIAEIISKSEFQNSNFHRAYRADDFTGMLILKPEIFLTPNEKNTNQNSFVYIDEPRGTLYFSGYKSSASDDRDIFRVEMTAEGEWGEPEVISDMINTHFDEAYPVVTDYGTTLYFCSKGHNSMGGYDIFRSKIDTATNTYSKPENLGVGVNSPFDDMLYIPDKSGRCAYFTSNRDNLNQAVSVFKVRLLDNSQSLPLAENSGQAKEERAQSTNSTNNEVVESGAKEIASVESKPVVDPAKKAKSLVNERMLMHKYADTAYLFVAKTRELVKVLTNKRDRANAISGRRKEEAQKLELEFESLLSDLALAKELDAFENKLLQAVKLKQEIYRNRFSADLAKQIAWNIGKQIKLKKQEVETLKVKAGEIQSLSVQGDFSKTSLAFSTLKDDYAIADSLTDYSGVVVKISREAVAVDVPNSEIAFADNLRQAFETETLYAELQNSMNQSKKDIPINIVDNRTTNVQEQRPVIVALQVQEVPFVPLLAEAIEEPELEISFIIDAVKPYKQIHEILIKDLLTANDILIEEELEINFTTDGVVPVDLVEPVYASLEMENVPDELLSLSFSVDGTTAVPQVETIAFQNIHIAAIDEELEIKFDMDGVEPADLIQPIDFVASEEAIAENESIFIDFSVDGVTAIPMVEPVDFFAEELAFETESLAIDFSVDGTTAIDLVQPVYANTDFEIEISDIPEIRFGIDGVEAIKQVELIAYNATEPAIDEDLEISTDVDQPEMEILPVVEQVMFASVNDFVVAEENLEINYEKEVSEALTLVEPIEISYASVEIAELDAETIEITDDQIKPIQTVEPIFFAASDEFSIPEEDIEIKFMELEPVAKVEEIQFAANDEVEIQETELEISFSNDIIKAENMIKVVQPIYYSAFENDIFQTDESDIEVMFFESEKEMPSIAANDAQETNIPAIGSELYYFRESVSGAADIETNYTDFEMLNRALTAPVDLSYEELLYSASLANNHEDKMKIFNQAFIHINRDWRAFNNAAVSAMNQNDLDQAECLLYQASLISENNGSILNNQGILACYKNDFENAKGHFLAAAELGTNSDYNLAVVNSMINSDNGNTNELEQKIGDHNYYEVLGDMMELKINE